MTGLGLCAYGIAYTCGLVGRGSPHSNREALSALDVVELAAHLGLTSVELPVGAMGLADVGFAAAVRQRARELGLRLVVGTGLATPDALREGMAFATRMGASVLRCTLSTILCGDRREVGLEGWRALLAERASALALAAPEAADRRVHIGVENHQDATSEDLLWVCERVGSPWVGVTLDTGNPLAVAEEPVAFARRVLPWIVNVHLKDYRMYGTPSGYVLAHCPVGAGVVDFRVLLALLDERPQAPRDIEMAALEGRRIRILEDDYWAGYPERAVSAVVPVLRLWRRREETGDWRTPWERGAYDELAAWERSRLKESVARLSPLLRGHAEG